MDRYTKRNGRDDNNWAIYMRDGVVQIWDKENNIRYEGAPIDKLAAYEDEDEQGLLWRLPCAIGQKVYHIWYTPCHNGETYPDAMGCDGCYDECDLKKAVLETTFNSLEQLVQVAQYFGKSYFLTREEAESKLRGMSDD